MYGIALVISALVFEAFGWVLTDLVFRSFPQAGPPEAIFWDLAVILMWAPIFLLWPKRRQAVIEILKRHWRPTVMVAVLGAIGSLMLLWALTRISAGLVMLFEKTGIFWAFLFGVMFLNEKVSKGDLISLGLGVIGLVLVSSKLPDTVGVAVLLVIAGAFCYSLGSYWVKTRIPKVDGLAFAFVRITILAVLVSLVFGIFGRIAWLPWPAIVLLVLANSSIVIGGKACYFAAHNCLPMSTINAFALFQPVFTFVGVWLIMGDSVNGKEVCGIVILLASLLAFVLVQQSKKGERSDVDSN